MVVKKSGASELLFGKEVKCLASELLFGLGVNWLEYNFFDLVTIKNWGQKKNTKNVEKKISEGKKKNLKNIERKKKGVVKNKCNA